MVLAETDPTFPWTTLLVNLTGALALGLLVSWGRGRWPSTRLAAISVGVLGSFTTFSTFAADAWDLGDGAGLVSYAALTLVGGVALGLVGIRLGRRLR